MLALINNLGLSSSCGWIVLRACSGSGEIVRGAGRAPREWPGPDKPTRVGAATVDPVPAQTASL